MKLSQKIQAMELSPIRKFVPYADAAVAAGKKVYRLNLGQPDIKTPKAFFDTVKNFDQEVLAYANSQGEATLLEALIGYYKRIGLDFQKKDLLITNGGSEAINMLTQTTRLSLVRQAERLLQFLQLLKTDISMQ